MRNKIIFVSLIALYILKEIISLYLNLNIETSNKLRDDNIGEIVDISIYNKEFNSSSLGNNEVWGLAKYRKPKVKVVDDNKSDENLTINFELRDKNGFYTIIIDKKEFDFWGVGKRGDNSFVLLYDNSQKKSRDALREYREGDRLYEDVLLHKISSNSIKFIDTTTHKKVIIPYFLVKQDEFKPEGNISEY
ncbi:hypothetical protein MNB_SV-15-293 [hydrothermal vent metagenome]|uniref:Uncharacterized protein n=1 Tax=hydrothermal vent metagenome TaxID=652676 RepID=A0A1W1EIM4_9ZZZZ